MTTDYGADVSTSGDLDVSGANISGLTTLGENLVRRFSTGPSVLAYSDGTDCIDVRTYFSSAMSSSDLSTLAQRLSSIAELDERVAQAEAFVQLVDEKLSIDVKVVPVTGKAFSLVISADALTVELLSQG